MSRFDVSLEPKPCISVTSYAVVEERAAAVGRPAPIMASFYNYLKNLGKGTVGKGATGKGATGKGAVVRGAMVRGAVVWRERCRQCRGCLATGPCRFVPKLMAFNGN